MNAAEAPDARESPPGLPVHRSAMASSRYEGRGTPGGWVQLYTGNSPV